MAELQHTVHQDETTPVKQGTSITTIGILLYITTLLFEIPGMLARYALVAGFFWFVTGVNRLLVAILWLIQSLQQAANPSFGATPPTPASPALTLGGGLVGFFSYLLSVATTMAPVVIFLITWMPVLFSVVTFFLPGGFFLRRFALGAREPSFRERQAVDNAIAQIQAAAQRPVPAPTGYYVIDKQVREAQVIGTTLYLTRPLIHDPNLAALLAHEFAHVASWDGRLVLALRRLVLFPVYLLSRTFGQLAPGAMRIGASVGSEVGCLAGASVWFLGLLLSLGGGGFGLWLLNLPWGWFWKQREYAADAYAAELGQSGNLVQYLSSPQLEHTPAFDIATPYLILDPPSSELRIDRLEHPENYFGAHRVDLRPYLIVAAAVLVVVCVLPALTSAVNRALHSVDNTTWVLDRFCLYRNCEPSAQASAGSQVQLGFRAPNQPNGVEVDAFYPDNTMGQVLGNYLYVDNTHILINITQRNGGVPLLLGGVMEITKQGNELTLRGDTGTYVLTSIR